MMPFFRSSLALLAGALFASCAGEIANPEEFLAQRGGGLGCTLTDVQAQLIVPQCGACHSSTTLSGSLDLSSANAPARLIGKPATCATAGKNLVDTSLTTGFLFDKLAGTATCGTVMPPSGTKLSAADISCIKEWLGGGN